MVTLDLAHHLDRTGEKVLPDGAEEILGDRSGLDFNHGRIADLIRNASKKASSRAIDEARHLLSEFLKKRSFAHILKGRILFGVIRRLIRVTIYNQARKKPMIDNKGLRMVLIEEVWRGKLGSDHRSLRRRLREAMSESARIRRA